MISVSVQTYSSEARDFGSEVVNLLEDAGWRVDQPIRKLERDSSDLFGVYFGPNEDPLRPALKVLVESLS